MWCSSVLLGLNCLHQLVMFFFILFKQLLGNMVMRLELSFFFFPLYLFFNNRLSLLVKCLLQSDLKLFFKLFNLCVFPCFKFMDFLAVHRLGLRLLAELFNQSTVLSLQLTCSVCILLALSFYEAHLLRMKCLSLLKIALSLDPRTLILPQF